MLSLLKTLAQSLRLSSSAVPLPLQSHNRLELGTTPPENRPDLTGSRWRHLDLRERLGGGAWGEVYRAYDSALDQEFALKLIHEPPHEQSADITPIDASFEEARVLARLRHPHVVLCYGADRASGSIGIWMELLTGRTLNAVVESLGRLHPREAALVGIEVSSALAEAHRHGILHRDVKAENVMRADGGRIVLFDFGLGVRYTRAVAEIAGTPLYMAPELLSGLPASRASEVYSVGVLLFFLVTGSYPVLGDTLDDLRRNHKDQRRSLRDLRPDADPVFVQIVERATAADPSRRFQSAGAIAEALAVVARTQGPLNRRGLLVGLSATAVAGGAVAYRWLDRPATLAPGATVYLAGLDNRAGDASLIPTGELLRLQLAQSSSFALLDSTRVDARLAEMHRPVSDLPNEALERQIAGLENVPLILFPTLAADRSGYSLTLRAVRLGSSPDQSRFIRTQAFPAASRSRIFDAVTDAARWARAVCGETLKEIEANDRRPEETTTESWPALQAFVSAELRAPTAPDDAIALLHLAVQQDPQFVLARMRLGDLLVETRRSREGYAAWESALSLLGSRRVSRREELRIRGMFAEDTGDYAASEQLFAAWMLEYPLDYRPRLYRASSQQSLGNLDQALDLLLDAQRKFPTIEFFPSHIVWLRLIRGELDAALPDIEKRRRTPGGEYAEGLLGKYHFLKNDFVRAEASFAHLCEAPQPRRRSLGYSLAACLFAEAGRFADSQRILEQGVAFDRTHGQLGMIADKIGSLAWLKLRAQKTEDARKLALESCSIESAPDRLATSATILAQAGFLSDASRLLKELDAARAWPIVQRARARIAGEIALAEKRFPDAAREFQVCDRLDSADGSRDYLAHLAVAMNQPAAPPLQRVVNQRGAIWFRPERQKPGVWSDALLDFAHATPDKVHARASASLYLQLRASGDPDPRKEIARQIANDT